MARVCIAALFVPVALALQFAESRQALAACAVGDITAISFSSTVLAPYNPFISFAPKLVTVSVTASKACPLELALASPAIPAAMSGAGFLSYDVQSPIGDGSLLFQGGAPVNTVHVDVPGGASPGTTSVQIAIPAGQIVADGLYSDASLTIQAFDKTGSAYTLLKSASMPVSSSVTKVCQFTLPQSPTLNFSSAISNSLPNPGFVQTVTFTGVSCTAPTVVKLSGGPLQSTDAPVASGGFDNFINFRASALFNSASATLDSSVQSNSTSSSRNVAGGSTINGSLTVTVNLLAGRPVMAGRYQTVLTVTIDPSL